MKQERNKREQGERREEEEVSGETKGTCTKRGERHARPEWLANLGNDLRELLHEVAFPAVVDARRRHVEQALDAY